MAIAVRASAALQATPLTATKAANTSAPFEAVLSALGTSGNDGATSLPAARLPPAPPVARSQDTSSAPANLAAGLTSTLPLTLPAVPAEATPGSTPPGPSKASAKTKPSQPDTTASRSSPAAITPLAAANSAALPPSSTVGNPPAAVPAPAPGAAIVPAAPKATAGVTARPIAAAVDAGDAAVDTHTDTASDASMDTRTAAPPPTVTTAPTTPPVAALNAPGVPPPGAPAVGVPAAGALTPGAATPSAPVSTASAASSPAASSPAAARSRNATILVDRVANDLTGPADPLTATLAAVTPHVGPTSATSLDTPATAETAATPAADPTRIAQQAGAQVAVSLSRALANGSRTVTVQLHPDDLGRVELRLGFHPSGLSVQMTLQSRETFDAFTQNRSSIEQQFAQAGVDLGSNGLDLRFQQNHSGQNPSDQNLPGRTPNQLSTGTGQSDAIDDPLVEPALRRLSGSAGLDIIA